jgi:hypothetical protein
LTRAFVEDHRFRRVEQLAEAHAQAGDLFGRGGVQEVEAAVKPWRGQMIIVAHVDIVPATAAIRGVPAPCRRFPRIDLRGFGGPSAAHPERQTSIAARRYTLLIDPPRQDNKNNKDHEDHHRGTETRRIKRNYELRIKN